MAEDGSAVRSERNSVILSGAEALRSAGFAPRAGGAFPFARRSATTRRDMALPASAVSSAQLPWLLCGALGGYLLLLFTNPVRSSLRDGLRCIRRYPALWVTLGMVGFCGALFQLAQRVYFFFLLPFEERPAFVWMRAAWRDSQLWLHGSTESFWYLPPHAVYDAVRESRLPALESTAGLFNCLLSPFPLAALAALLLLVNWGGHHRIVLRALRKRFGGFGWVLYAGVVVCALAAFAKPLLYAAPQFIVAGGGSAAAGTLWIQWAPVVEWLGFLFEYLFGVCLQIYLILLAFVWVRGFTFTHAHLLDFAIRRCAFVLKWALVVMLLSTALINVPLILKNFPAFQSWFPDNAEVIEGRLRLARAVLTGVLLLCSTVQITLVFHSESLLRALRDHARFVVRHVWPFGWFVILAALHFYLFQVAQGLVLRGFGEETAAGLVWGLVVPWLRGILAAWLLAAWVCLFKRCDTGHPAAENWIQF